MDVTPLETLAGAVDGLAAIDAAELDLAVLQASMGDLSRQTERLRGLLASWVDAFARRGGPRLGGFRDAGQFLQNELKQSHSDARRTTNTARQLEQLPGTRQALDDGQITFDQAASIAETAKQLTRATDDDPDEAQATEDRGAGHLDRRAKLRAALDALLDDTGDPGRPDRLGGVVAVAPLDALTPGSESGGLLRGRTPLTAEALRGLVCQHGLQLFVTDRRGCRCGWATPSGSQHRPNGSR